LGRSVTVVLQSDMATTISIRIDDGLKRRIARFARGRGQTAHAFMVEAIRSEAVRAAQREEFVRDAREAEAELERTGLAYDMKDVHAFVRARVLGKPARRPKLKSWR
jgi:predicted transcriptional regulator